MALPEGNGKPECKKYVQCTAAVEQSGERMAVLTTLVGLLELKHLQMEGEDGTRSLESDIQLIEVGYAIS